MEPAQELTTRQKLKVGMQAAGAFARNPKALVALVRYQLAERKKRKQSKRQPGGTENTTPANTAE